MILQKKGNFKGLEKNFLMHFVKCIFLNIYCKRKNFFALIHGKYKYLWEKIRKKYKIIKLSKIFYVIRQSTL